MEILVNELKKMADISVVSLVKGLQPFDNEEMTEINNWRLRFAMGNAGLKCYRDFITK